MPMSISNSLGSHRGNLKGSAAGNRRAGARWFSSKATANAAIRNAPLTKLNAIPTGSFSSPLSSTPSTPSKRPRSPIPTPAGTFQSPKSFRMEVPPARSPLLDVNSLNHFTEGHSGGEVDSSGQLLIADHPSEGRSGMNGSGELERAGSVPRHVSPDAETFHELDKENVLSSSGPLPHPCPNFSSPTSIPPLRARSIRFFEPIPSLPERKAHPLELSEILGVLPAGTFNHRRTTTGEGVRKGSGSPPRRPSARGEFSGFFDEKGRLSEVSAYEPTEGEPEVDEVRYLREQAAGESADAEGLALAERRRHRQRVLACSQRSRDALLMGDSTTAPISSAFSSLGGGFPRVRVPIRESSLAMAFPLSGLTGESALPFREWSLAPAELREERQREVEKQQRKAI
ncbi:unnamed protein product [Phytomonas sp. Hart1]|nr:unnamed protein product [Phytomonas sp. Hart1]|eukprot:CCW69714.1 unnamed protein product [Phytomonas sp. isolate Hart1]